MRKALCIGINNYSRAPLSGCINDASAISTTLETNGDGSPNFDTQLNTNISTKSELLQLVHNHFKGEHDIALFYFSGHGMKNDIDTYLVTTNYDDYNPGISVTELIKIANDSKCRSKIIILDCCHSGGTGTINALGNEASFIGKGVTILTASKSDERSLEINGHGLFTNLLLDALQGGAADISGNITPGAVYSYIDKSLGALDQRPVFKTNITEFTSIRKMSPKVPAETLRKLTKYFPSPELEFPLDPSFEFTNTPLHKPLLQEPYANDINVSVFQDLQKFQSVGLVVPINAAHMYFAAMEHKQCKLTALGYHYWKLVREKRI